MELFIQMGHGMQDLALDLMQENGPNTIILSPLNSTSERMIKFSKKVAKLKGRLLIDPQLYYPRKYHKNLSQYDYWPKNDITFIEQGACDSIIKPLYELNEHVNSAEFILPSFAQSKVDKRWNHVQKCIIESAKKHAGDYSLIHTIALTSEVLTDESQVQSIISFVEEWDVSGVYIVCEHPERFYLVSKPLWVSSLLELVAGIKRIGKKVIVGYSSHQLLCLALSKCDAIASGNFLNVRWFQSERFETLQSDEISRRATWYYCPQALSEFKIPFLDIAKRMNILDRLAPPPEMMNFYCEMLFGSALPSSTNYSEKDSHRHYLLSLHHQCKMAVRASYEDTKNFQLITLETAEQLLSGLREKSIRGQDRDFGDFIDVNRAAISAHDMAYRFALSQEWAGL